jgi:O-antigen/teichoic acid export membrane protein
VSDSLVAEPADVLAIEPRTMSSRDFAEPRSISAPLDAAPHDRLAVGMAFMLALTVVQRGVGLLRNVLFCRMLEPEELGRWNLAFSFLMLAGPLVVLGLPGAFGRYAEYYRKRGRLRMFVSRTAFAAGLLSAMACCAMLLAPRWFAKLVFRDAGQAHLMLMLAGVLGTVVVFNYFTELFTALRRSRIASIMQFTHSLVFAVVGVGLLSATSYGVEAVATAHGVASLFACLCVLGALAESWRTAPTSPLPFSQVEFWGKLLPFAGWIWAMSLLANLSDLADRYMILYFAGADASAASALVGQYHSSRVAPDLLASLATMLAGILLPYNTHDWEAGHRSAVSRRINLALKLTGLSFTAAGAGILLFSPLLFQWVLGGKYDLGEIVLPWALLLCIWYSLTVLALNYVWCAERAGFAVVVMGFGLATNILLNAALVPRWGLTGAMIATAASNAVTLAMACGISMRLGMSPERGVVIAALAPFVLLLGAVPAVAAAACLGLLAVGSERLFTNEDKARVVNTIRERLCRSQ